MTNVARLPAVATVAMVAVVGIALLSPSSSSATQQIPRTRQTLIENGVRFSFSVPTKFRWGGWERFSSLPTKKSPAGPISLNKSIEGGQAAEAIIYWSSFPNGDHADPCSRLLNHSVGQSAAALAAAVAAAPGTKLVKGPSDVTLGGHPAKFVWLKVSTGVGCDPGFFYTWRDVYGGALWATTTWGSTMRIWIVEVDGTRLFIAAATNEQATLRLKNEIYWIVQSIRFS